MSTNGWMNFGRYGANRDPGNAHGAVALAAALEEALERMIIDPRRRDNIRVRWLQVRYIWDAAVDALAADDIQALEEAWDDVIAELDSDWGAYTYVGHIGLGA